MLPFGLNMLSIADFRASAFGPPYSDISGRETTNCTGIPLRSTLTSTISLSDLVFLACEPSESRDIAFLLAITAATFSVTAFEMASKNLQVALQSSFRSISYTPFIL